MRRGQVITTASVLYRIVGLFLLHSWFSVDAAQEAALSGYTPEAVDLVEFLYGDGILALGGTESIDDMFAGINLTNTYILDIGSGLGGADTYLAQKYTVTILGVDPECALVERATQRALQLRESFQGTVRFEQLRAHDNLADYPDNTFDIVMSREAILHVPHTDKGAYFAEMLRVLKPGGLLLIDDWMHPSPDYTDAVKEMMEADGIPYNLITPHEYTQLLQAAGFTHVVVRDTTDHAYSASASVYKRAQDCGPEMIQRFGKEMYLFAIKSWCLQTDIFRRRELLTGIITAQKQREKQ